MVTAHSKTAILGILAATACGGSSSPAPTGGIGDAGGGGGSCPSALVVVDSDFTSTNISVLSPAGALLSGSILSSAARPPGVSSALSGDVVLPLGRTPGEIVLVDRANAVLTWMDPASGAVKHQLQVGTGFPSDPYDYQQISPTKAYVTRYASNMSPGKQPNDQGGDLLIVDPGAVSITRSVPFAPDGAFLPRPDRMLRIGGDVWVTLDRYNADFTSAGDARIAGVSTASDAVAWTLDLPGLANCDGMTLSPSGKTVALSCAGVSTDSPPTKRSGIVLLDATMHPPVEVKRIPAATQLGAELGFTLAFASEDLLVGVAIGDMATGKNDLAYSAVVSTGKVQMIADGGMAFVLGDALCLPGCGDLCFVADATMNALRVWKVTGATLTPQAAVPVDPSVGLPPRVIGTI
jgi:hypothetical protein